MHRERKKQRILYHYDLKIDVSYVCFEVSKPMKKYFYIWKNIITPYAFSESMKYICVLLTFLYQIFSLRLLSNLTSVFSKKYENIFVRMVNTKTLFITTIYL